MTNWDREKDMELGASAPGATIRRSSHPARASYRDQPSRSPWIAQLQPDGPESPLSRNVGADVVVVGAGIAGVATAFFVLRHTALSVVLVERDRVARGATGRNAGQLTTYFERPLASIAAELGAALAADGQRGLEEAHDLLDLMVSDADVSVRIERFTGHLGMFNLHHLQVHLDGNTVRLRGGLAPQPCLISEDAEFLGQLAAEYDGLYTVVPQATVRDLLQIDDDRYRAVLSNRAGCANSGLLAQQVLGFLQEQHPNRFQFFDHSDVELVVAGDGQAVVHAGGFRLTARHVVLCTNGFVDYRVEDSAGQTVRLAGDQQIVGRVAYMTAFVEDRTRPPAAMSYIRNAVIGGDTAYVYVTRRTYDRPADVVTLTCMGGPEYPFHGMYDAGRLFPAAMLTAMDDQVRPYAAPNRPPRLPYDFHWHGLMGYNDCGVRVVGRHPRHPELMYNLGCNGVGFLPSIYGAHRVSRLLGGEQLPASIFDPRAASG